jgi:hypothetical protein
MIKSLMIGGGFQHQKSVSIHNKLPKNFRWVKGSEKYDIQIFIDSSIKINLNKPKINKFAWVFESEKIFSIDWIVSNVELVSNSYEYLFTHNIKLLGLAKNFVFVPANSFWVQTPRIYQKNKLVSMIYSNKRSTEGHRKRIEFANKYKGKIDAYGFGINPIKYKEEGLNDYMFSIVVENGKYGDYFSEKVLDCFATGTIPLYWGCDNIGNYFNSDGIIKLTDDFDLSTLTKELYHSKKKSISENYEEVLKYEILEEWILKYIENK